MDSERSTTLLGVAAAVGASLCCLGPLLAFAAGLGGFAAAFAWMAPLRVPLAMLTIGLLVLAWYRVLRPRPEQGECACDSSGLFATGRWGALAAVSVLALALLAFPNFAERLYPQVQARGTADAVSATAPSVRVTITGMTCESCVPLIESALAATDGVTAWFVSYERGEAVVNYDPERITPAAVRDAIASTGYGAELGEVSP